MAQWQTLSDRINTVAPSATLAVDSKAKAMKAAGQPQEEARAKLKEWRALQTDLVEQTGLKRQYDRERAGG